MHGGRRAHLEHLADVHDALGGGGGGERDDGYAREQLAQPAELLVVRPEVVAPAAHAVRFVHHDAREQPRLAARQLLQCAAQPTAACELLGRHVQALGDRLLPIAVSAAFQVRKDSIGVAHLCCRRQERGRHAAQRRIGCVRAAHERLHLVLHEREQRTHDDRYPARENRWELEAKGLATAGRQQHEDVLIVENVEDDVALRGAEGRVAEDVPVGRVDVVRAPCHIGVAEFLTVSRGKNADDLSAAAAQRPWPLQR